MTEVENNLAGFLNVFSAKVIKFIKRSNTTDGV